MFEHDPGGVEPLHLVGGRLLRRLDRRSVICIHEKYWNEVAQREDEEDRKNPDICWECIDAAREKGN